MGALSLIPSCLGISGHPSGCRQGYSGHTGARSAGRSWWSEHSSAQQYSAETRQTFSVCCVPSLHHLHQLQPLLLFSLSFSSVFSVFAFFFRRLFFHDFPCCYFHAVLHAKTHLKEVPCEEVLGSFPRLFLLEFHGSFPWLLSFCFRLLPGNSHLSNPSPSGIRDLAMAVD